MDWREALAIYYHAKAEFDRAQALFEQAVTGLSAARGQENLSMSPWILGVELGRRRALRESRRFREATFRFTQGRPLDEVLWSLPDDI